MREAVNANEVLAAHWRSGIDLLHTRLGDETVLLHTGSAEYYRLDALGSQLLDHLLDGGTAADFIAVHAGAHDTEVERFERDICELLCDMVAQGIVARR